MGQKIERRKSGENAWLVCLVAWLVPGAGHLWLGQRSKGLILLVTLPLMFTIGLLADGAVASLDFSQVFTEIGRAHV